VGREQAHKFYEPTDLTARPAGLQRQVFAQRIAALFQCLEQGCAERVLLVDRRPWREGAEPEDFWRRLRERRARAGNRRASEHGDEVSSSHSHCVPQARIVQGRRFAPPTQSHHWMAHGQLRATRDEVVMGSEGYYCCTTVTSVLTEFAMKQFSCAA